MIQRKKFVVVVSWTRSCLPFVAVALWIGILSQSGNARTQSGADSDTGSPRHGVYQSDDLEMVVKAGFGGFGVRSYQGNWIPFRITVVNRGAAIDGDLVVTTASHGNPSQQIHEYAKQVHLPAGSRQSHEIPAFVHTSHPDPLVSLVSDGRVVAQIPVGVERFYNRSDQLEVAVVDSDLTALNNVNSAEVDRLAGRQPFTRPGAAPVSAADSPRMGSANSGSPAPGGRRGRGWPGGPQTYVVHTIPIQIEDLPRDFVSYDALDALVIGDSPLSQLAHEQIKALKWWVANGGFLIVTGAVDVAGLSAAGFDDIMPVELRGNVVAGSLSELTELYGPFESTDPNLVMSAALRSHGRSLLESEGRTLVSESSYGRGLVRFIALNPKLNPYRIWVGSRSLWAELLIPAAERKPYLAANWITSGRRGNASSSRWGLQNVLFQLAEIEAPSSTYIIAFLLCYILIVGPLNYFVLKRSRKLDVAWITIPAVVISFTVISVVVARVTRGGASIAADASLVEVHQRENLALITGGLLIMPTAKGSEEISLPGPEGYLSEPVDGSVASSTSAVEPVRSLRESDRFVLHVPTSTWTSRIFTLRSTASDQLPVSLTASDDSSELEHNLDSVRVARIRNVGRFRIARAVYMSPTGVSAPFDVSPGESQTIELSRAESSPFVEWYSGLLAPDSHEKAVFDELAQILDREIGGPAMLSDGFFATALMPAALAKLDRPIVVGFIDGSPFALELGGSLKRRSKALCVIHL